MKKRIAEAMLDAEMPWQPDENLGSAETIIDHPGQRAGAAGGHFVSSLPGQSRVGRVFRLMD